MKKSIKISLALVTGLILFELVSAPVEWLWPATWGGTTYWQGTSDKKEIALTFDDGPSRYTEKILDILNKSEVPATFFVMGRQAAQYPELLQRMARENHEIGNHTYSFAAQKLKFFSGIGESQIADTQKTIKELTGVTPRYYRSPGGQMGRQLLNYVRRNGLKVVYGALPIPHPDDDADKQLKTIRDTIEPGAIIILHDGDDRKPDSSRPASTVKLLPLLLKEIEKLDYKIVPLCELLKSA